jgi:hypothetical protein
LNATSIPENQPVPVVYTHSVKIEDTAKGIRLWAHVYTNDKQTAINEAITTYLETKLKAEKGLRNSTRWKYRMTSEEATAPQQQYTHSLKLEETAKGLRISVHVYANDRDTAVEEAFRTYNLAKLNCKERDILMAPMSLS